MDDDHPPTQTDAYLVSDEDGPPTQDAGFELDAGDGCSESCHKQLVPVQVPPSTPTKPVGPPEPIDSPPSLPRKQAPRAPATPKVLVEHLSYKNAKARLDRLFAPKANGQLKVPEPLLAKWRTADGQKEIIEEFRSTGYCKEPLLKYRVGHVVFIHSS